MKKRLIGAAIIVGAALIIPKVISTNVAQSLQNFATSLNAQPNYTAELINIDSGWFSTTAKIDISLDLSNIKDLDMAGEQLSQVFLVQVQHGPVVFGHSTGLALSNWTVSTDSRPFNDYLDWPADKAFYQIKGSTSLLGNTSYHDEIVPFTYHNDVKQIKGQYSGYSGTGTLNDNHFSYTSSMRELTINDGESFGEIKNLEFNTSINGNWMDMLNSVPVESDLGLEIESMKIANSQEVLFASQQFDFAVANKITDDGKLANILQTFNLQKMAVKDFNIDDVKLQTSLNNLNIDVLTAYQKLVNSLSAQAEQTQLAELQKFATQNLLAFLQVQPEVNFNEFSGKLPQGEFTLSSLNKITSVDALPAQLDDPAFWIQHSNSDSKLQITKAVALELAQNYVKSQLLKNPQAAELEIEQIEQLAQQQGTTMIDNFVSQGFLIEEGEMLKSAILLKDGELSVNDNAIPLPY